MRTRSNVNHLKNLSLMILICISAMSCFGDDDAVITNEDIPELTLKVTECPLDALVVTPEVKILGSSGRYFVQVTVTVTCMGEPVNKAELLVKYGWVERNFKIETNDTGKAMSRRLVTSSVPPSGKVTITIEGEDGTRPMTVEF